MGKNGSRGEDGFEGVFGGEAGLEHSCVVEDEAFGGFPACCPLPTDFSLLSTEFHPVAQEIGAAPFFLQSHLRDKFG